MDDTVFLDTVLRPGRFLSERRALVPAESPSVRFGVGLRETARVVRGMAPLLDDHLVRLREGCAQVGLPEPEVDWRGVVDRLARRNRRPNGVLRLTVGHGFCFARLAPLPRGLAAERRDGIDLCTARLERPLPGIKHTSWLPAWQLEGGGRREVALLDRAGRLLETSRSNLFVVRNGRLETAPASSVLPGVARGRLMRLSEEEGWPVRQRAPRLCESAQWDEVFASNAVRGVRAVRRIDSLTLRGDGARTRRLQARLDREMGLGISSRP